MWNAEVKMRTAIARFALSASFNRVGNSPRGDGRNMLECRSTRGALPTRLNDRAGQYKVVRPLGGRKRRPLTLTRPPKRRCLGRGEWISRRFAVLPARRGFTLVELISTCVLLGVVFSVSIPLLVTVARERLSAEQRQFALQHAANLLERAVVQDWSELPPGEQTLTAAPSDVVAMLPGLERQLTVTELSEVPRSKQVAVSIRWQGRAGKVVAPLALSAWVYPVQEGQP